MKIPIHSTRGKALIIVDIQPAFLNDRNNYIIDNTLKLINSIHYDLYVETVFYTKEGSLWELQQKWSLLKDDKTHTVEQITSALKDQELISIEKETKSVFKGNKPLFDILKQANIEEVHIVGVDSNDCVLASAYEAFDLGFVTYVIEECCQSSSSDELHTSAIELLRHQHMTNNSCIEDIEMKEINL